MIIKTCTLDGDFICQFGFDNCLLDHFTIKNINGRACVYLKPLEQTADGKFSHPLNKTNKGGGIYSIKNNTTCKYARIFVRNGSELVYFYNVKNVRHVKGGIIFVASSFKIVDNRSNYSRWLINELEPTQDDIFNDMKSELGEVNGLTWMNKRYWDIINEAAARLQEFKNKYIIPLEKNERRKHESKCWRPNQ